jgi:hypothetical protein
VQPEASRETGLNLGLRAAVAFFVVVAVEAIWLTGSLLGGLPVAAVATVSAALFIAIVFGALVTVSREDLQRIEITRTLWRKVAGTASVIVALCGAATIIVDHESPSFTPPPDPTPNGEPREPITAHLEPLLDRNQPPKFEEGRPWQLVVPNPDLLPPIPSMSPPQLPPDKDCADLWKMGVDAQGQPPTTADYKVTLHGHTDVTVIDLRARILNRFPPTDGALLMCLPIRMGPVPEDEPVSCDLTKQLDDDTVRCSVIDGAGRPILLRDSKTIPLHKGGDPTTLQLSVRLPASPAVQWQLEAHVVTPNGDDPWVPLGKPLRSLGIRDTNAGELYQQYAGAYLFGIIGWKPGDPGSPPTPLPPSATPHP